MLRRQNKEKDCQERVSDRGILPARYGSREYFLVLECRRSKDIFSKCYKRTQHLLCLQAQENVPKMDEQSCMMAFVSTVPFGTPNTITS